MFVFLPQASGKVNSSLISSLLPSLLAFVVVQSLSCLWLFEIPWTAASLAGFAIKLLQLFTVWTHFSLREGIMSFSFFNYFQCLAYSSCSINIQTKSFICSNRDYEKAILQTILVEIKIIILYLESFFWEHVNPLGLGGKKMKVFSGLAFLERQPTFFFSWSIIGIKWGQPFRCSFSSS